MKLGKALATGVAQEQPLDQQESPERPEETTARTAEPQAPAPEEVPAAR
ncbi:hypothetical protein ACFC09_44445 [Streptomyces sp. NPDC056161]